MTDKPTEPKPVFTTVGVDWHVPDDMPSHYTTLFVAQAGKYEITVSFFQPRLPVFTGTPEQIAAQAKQITSVRADCVSRIIVPAEQVPELAKVLDEAYKVYLAAYKQPPEAGGTG